MRLPVRSLQIFFLRFRKYYHHDVDDDEKSIVKRCNMYHWLSTIIYLSALIASASAFVPSPRPSFIFQHYTYKSEQLKAVSTDEVEAVSFTCSIKDKPVLSRRGREKGSATYEFSYNATKIVVGNDASGTLRGIVLIHPIGVGIGRWYYDRLLGEIKQQQSRIDNQTIIIAPDLLACGTASNPTLGDAENAAIRRLPLFKVDDWSEQVDQLMAQTEQSEGSPIEWSLVSNGGCVPIAVDVAHSFIESRHSFRGNITNLVLSATPRLTGLLRESSDPEKVEKAYKRLSGIVGKLFWSYSLFNNGRFIRKFSEKNLAADPDNLGPNWTPQCVATAKIRNSRYSTFAFLAGALQKSCKPSFEALRDKTTIDVITGGDVRRNPASR